MWKETIKLRLFGWLKIPLLGFVQPQVLELNDKRCVVKIPLSWRTKNHLGTMYFGVLSTGADCAGGLAAMNAISSSGKPVALIFKDFHAEFLKRAEGDVYFTCEQVQEARDLVQKAIDTKERQNTSLKIVATVPDKMGNEPIANFALTLSLKLKERT
ncbi:MAG: PaaI family thioesterase [Bacteriovoracia bacterium]